MAGRPPDFNPPIGPRRPPMPQSDQTNRTRPNAWRAMPSPIPPRRTGGWQNDLPPSQQIRQRAMPGLSPSPTTAVSGERDCFAHRTRPLGPSAPQRDQDQPFGSRERSAAYSEREERQMEMFTRPRTLTLTHNTKRTAFDPSTTQRAAEIARLDAAKQDLEQQINNEQIGIHPSVETHPSGAVVTASRSRLPTPARVVQHIRPAMAGPAPDTSSRFSSDDAATVQPHPDFTQTFSRRDTPAPVKSATHERPGTAEKRKSEASIDTGAEKRIKVDGPRKSDDLWAEIPTSTRTTRRDYIAAIEMKWGIPAAQATQWLPPDFWPSSEDPAKSMKSLPPRDWDTRILHILSDLAEASTDLGIAHSKMRSLRSQLKPTPHGEALTVTQLRWIIDRAVVVIKESKAAQSSTVSETRNTDSPLISAPAAGTTANACELKAKSTNSVEMKDVDDDEPQRQGPTGFGPSVQPVRPGAPSVKCKNGSVSHDDPPTQGQATAKGSMCTSQVLPITPATTAAARIPETEEAQSLKRKTEIAKMKLETSEARSTAAEASQQVANARVEALLRQNADEDSIAKARDKVLEANREAAMAAFDIAHNRVRLLQAKDAEIVYAGSLKKH